MDRARFYTLIGMVADPGCLSDPNFLLFSIPDPGSKGFRIRIKEFKYF
jgi:hypothetical protein